MVAPEREKPGMSAIAWAAPTPSGVAPGHAAGDALVALAFLWGRRPAPQPLGAVEHEAVEDQEERGRAGGREEVAQRVLEQQAEEPGRDGADDEQPAQPGVAVVADLAVAQRAPETAQDARPVAPEEGQQDEGRGQMGGHEERDEERVVLMDVPAEQLREDHAVAEAGDRGTAR